ncbi:MAG: hypothetical protein IPH16_15635 [Haliscomenobacter sp.]|nr:hypothetical protein [Haliscomenobacter sp.]
MDTAVVNLIDKKERVHSRGNFYEESSSLVRVVLPENYEEPGRSYEVISWAYWIGVGEEAEGQYREANRAAKFAKSATNAVKNFGVLAGPYGALASLPSMASAFSFLREKAIISSTRCAPGASSSIREMGPLLLPGIPI